MNEHLTQIADLLDQSRQKVLSRWQKEVAKTTKGKTLDEAALADNMNDLIQELSDTLRSGNEDSVD